MPTYQYQCAGCGHRFETVTTIREHDERKSPTHCPRCKSAKVKQLLAVFQAVTSSKA